VADQLWFMTCIREEKELKSHNYIQAFTFGAVKSKAIFGILYIHG